MDMGMSGGMGSMSEMLGEMLEGDAKAKFTGMRDVGGAKMAVIKLTMKIKPPGQGDMSVEQRMELSGTTNLSAKFE